MVLWNILLPEVTIGKEDLCHKFEGDIHMSPTFTCLALALMGADLGYQPAPNGGTEFIIQINPAMLKTLQPGDPIECDVPREAQGLRPTHFSVRTGNDPLPKIVSNPAAVSAAPATAPIVTASPVMPAVANSTAPPPAFALVAGCRFAIPGVSRDAGRTLRRRRRSEEERRAPRRQGRTPHRSRPWRTWDRC